MLKQVSTWCVVVMMVAALAGCEQQPPGSAGAGPAGSGVVGTVAVVNIDRVMAETGAQERMTNVIQRKGAELQSRHAQLQSRLQSEFNTMLSEAGEEPTDDESARIQQRASESMAQINADQQRMQQEMQSLEMELFDGFMTQVRAAALHVAQQRGFSVVMVQHDAVLAATPEANVTEAVIARLNEQPDAGTNAAAPAPDGGSGSLDARLAPEPASPEAAEDLLAPLGTN